MCRSVPLALAAMALLTLALRMETASSAPSADEKAADPLTAVGGVVGRADPLPPLARAFEDFHFQTILDCMTGVMGEIREYAAQNRPDRPPIVLSGNPAGGMHVPRWVELAGPFDYFNIECDVVNLSDPKVLAHFFKSVAMTEAVGTTLLVMPNSASNAQWSRNEDPLAYAKATGLSYAFGSHMHVPWCLYDGSQFNRFYGSLEGHQPIFGMIHDHADWFDGYTTPLWHVLDVPYDGAGAGDLKALEARVLDAVQRGVPTVLRLKGEQAPGGGDRFSGSEHIRTTFHAEITDPVGDSPFAADAAFSRSFLPPLPRVSAEPSTAPIILHLIRRFDDDSREPAGGSFSVSKKFLKGARVTNVEIAAPHWHDLPAAEVDWKMEADGDLRVEVGQVAAWALVRIHTAEPVKLPGIIRQSLRNAMPESEIPLMRMIRFSDTWARPDWVDEALASETDPLDGYHITRISWSYDYSLKTKDYAEAHGMAFHGSDSFLHAYMSPDGSSPQEGIAAFPPDWPGWARYPDGQPMPIRPDWNPPRYGASFASPEYRHAMIERAKSWIDKGAAGIQFDDISGMVNRVWQYGGDFSDAFFTRFRDYLVRRNFPGVNADTPLDALRGQVMEAMDYRFAHRQRENGAIAVPMNNTRDYPGLVWVGSPHFPRPQGALIVEARLRVSEGDGSGVEMLLMDGDRSVYLSRLPLEEVLSAAKKDAWVTIRFQYDLLAQTVRQAFGPDGAWSAPLPLDMPLTENMKTLSVAIMADPRKTGIEVGNLSMIPELGEEKLDDSSGHQ